MNLAIELLHRLDEPKLNQDEKALLRCALAKALEGAGSDEARVLLRETLDGPGALAGELRALALLRSAEVERADGRLTDALTVLAQAGALVEACGNDALMGIFHGTLASTLIALSLAEQRQDYADRA